jgi:hypothetical protein
VILFGINKENLGSFLPPPPLVRKYGGNNRSEVTTMTTDPAEIDQAEVTAAAPAAKTEQQPQPGTNAAAAADKPDPSDASAEDVNGAKHHDQHSYPPGYDYHSYYSGYGYGGYAAPGYGPPGGCADVLRLREQQRSLPLFWLF